MVSAEPGRSRIVLVGFSEYNDQRLPPIPVVPKCMNDLREVLTDGEHGLVLPEHCADILDEPDIARLGQRLHEGMAKAQDLLVVYVVGHGVIGRRHELYLAMRGTDLANPAFGALPYAALHEAVLHGSAAATKIVILDCCYSGRAMGEPLADDSSAVVGQLGIAGTYLLASAHRDQTSLVLPGEEHTAFTGRLLRLLRSGIADADEYLTIDDVYRHLSVMMASEGLPEPQKQGTQTADRFLIVRNHAHAARAVDAFEKRRTEAVARAKESGWVRELPALEQILADQLAVLSADHESCLRTRQYLAHAEGAAGNPEQAVSQLREVLAAQSTELGDDHADTMRSRQFLAVNLGETGQRDEAISILRVLLADRRRVLGHGNDDACRTQHVLARNLALVGLREEAVALLRELLAVRESSPTPGQADADRVRLDLAALTDQQTGHRGGTGLG